ncbi:MAG TPA: Rrf2 family transcriptional regulator [Bradyrhizobium sp.]|nr:Rrf2 family transcriptional regulator [Bradyrhizobium sp.]
MRLTVYTDHALRLLMYLALKKDGLATIAEIAATYDISRNHLMKVAYELVVAGYVVSVRGRGGGLRLAEPVEAITIGEVVRKTEHDMALVSCMKPGDTSCVIFPACALRGAMKRASAAFFEALDNYTLGDLIQPGVKLRALLTISQSGRDVAPRSKSARTRRLGIAGRP